MAHHPSGGSYAKNAVKATQPFSLNPTAHLFCSTLEHSAVQVWIPPTLWGYLHHKCIPVPHTIMMFLEGRACSVEHVMPSKAPSTQQGVYWMHYLCSLSVSKLLARGASEAALPDTWWCGLFFIFLKRKQRLNDLLKAWKHLLKHRGRTEPKISNATTASLPSITEGNTGVASQR